MKMNTTRAARWTATAAVAALAIGATGLSAQAAYAADAPSFELYDETDSPNPLKVTNGLVFYKAADMGWAVNQPIADVASLAFTVAEGTSYAPAFQLVTSSSEKPYARITWEANQNGVDAKAGAYTDLEDGKWWSNKIASGPGSQSDPQPLSFFQNGGGAGWTNVVVGAIALHQGTTTESTSTVTSLSYNGASVPLGNVDATPFDQAAVDAAIAVAVAAATGPLNGQISGLQAEVATKTATIEDLQGKLAAKTDEVDALKAEAAEKDAAIEDLTDENAAKTDQIDDLNGQLDTANATIDDLRAEIDGLEQQVTDLTAAGAAKAAELADVQATLAERSTKLIAALEKVTELQDEIQDLQDEILANFIEIQDLNGQITTLKSQLDARNATITSLNGQITTLKGQVASLTTYKNTHHTADGTYIGWSRALLSSTPVAGKSVGVSKLGTLATATNVKYQWYLSGKAVSGATKSTYLVPSSAKGKSISVKVTGTSKYVSFAVQSNTVNAR